MLTIQNLLHDYNAKFFELHPEYNLCSLEWLTNVDDAKASRFAVLLDYDSSPSNSLLSDQMEEIECKIIAQIELKGSSFIGFQQSNILT